MVAEASENQEDELVAKTASGITITPLRSNKTPKNTSSLAYNNSKQKMTTKKMEKPKYEKNETLQVPVGAF